MCSHTADLVSEPEWWACFFTVTSIMFPLGSIYGRGGVLIIHRKGNRFSSAFFHLLHTIYEMEFLSLSCLCRFFPELHFGCTLYNAAGWTAVNASCCPNWETGEAGRSNETTLESKAYTLLWNLFVNIVMTVKMSSSGFVFSSFPSLCVP